MAYYERYLFVTRHPQYHCMLQKMTERAILEGITCLGNIRAFPQYFSDDCIKSQTERMRLIYISQRNVLRRRIKLGLCLFKIHPKCYKTFEVLYFFFKNTLMK